MHLGKYEAVSPGFPAGRCARTSSIGLGTMRLGLIVGDRAEGDEVVYPDEDLAAGLAADARRCFAHKNGEPY